MVDWLRNDKQSVDMPPMGGTEILKAGLYKHTNISQHDNINLLLSTPNINNIRYTKKNLMWQHLNFNDESLQPYKDPSFIKSINYSVYVSNWQYEKFRYFYGVPSHNSFIIKNAIEPIEFIEKPKSEKIKLIYTSTPYRGLDVLLNVMDVLDRDDIELDVYSSTLVYGTKYQEYHAGMWDHILDKAKNTKNVNYIGYATNDEVKKALQSAHIFAYPSTFEETCCLAMIEAGAAGCKMVTTNLGALYETGSEYASMIPSDVSSTTLVKRYAKLLNDEIDNYWSLNSQDSLKQQSDFYNKNYSWDKKSQEWNRLFELISST